MGTPQSLVLGLDGGCLTVTINRPTKLNALNADVLTELAETIASVATVPRSQIAGVVLTGAGEKAFIAGADIAQMSRMTPVQARAFAALGQAVPDACEALDRPVVAAVNGYALGGGCELALGCDMIYACPPAAFAQPEVSLGIVPAFGGCTRLVAAVGPGRAREMVYTGRTIDAAQAHAWGLVTALFEDRETMLAAARSTIDLIGTRAAGAVAAAKSAIASTVREGPLAGLAAERTLFAAAFSTDDMREGTSAFVEKRPPVFTDR
ncbi:MAG: enoyl-CoA hydratase [Micrococcales bacterium]|nr:MAG: enoyl-CoA hydratase [Micrococcales bacterium]